MTIAAAIFGILTLVTGRFTLTYRRVVYGWMARAVGVLLILPLVSHLAIREWYRGTAYVNNYEVEFAALAIFLPAALLIAAYSAKKLPSKKRFLASVDELAEPYQAAEPAPPGPADPHILPATESPWSGEGVQKTQ